MYINNNPNNTAFGRLRIKIYGSEFRQHPYDKKRVLDALKNNEQLQQFFAKHKGKIKVTSGFVMKNKTHEYPDCIKIVPGRSLPFDTFTTKAPSFYTNIQCTYNRAFALRNLFKRPVHVNAGIRASENDCLDWETCINFTLKLIKENLPESIIKCESNRLKVEKP